MTKKYVFLVAGAVITAVVAAAWYFNRQQSAAEELVLYGNVDIRQVSLAFDGSERVAEMRVQEGDRVQADRYWRSWIPESCSCRSRRLRPGFPSSNRCCYGSRTGRVRKKWRKHEQKSLPLRPTQTLRRSS